MHTTIPISVRIDIKAFAELVRGMQIEGFQPRTKSDALNTATLHLAALFNKKHSIEPIGSVQEAVDYLRAVGLPLETSERPTRAVLKATADDAMLLDGFQPDKQPITKSKMTFGDLYIAAATAMERLGMQPPTREEFEQRQASKVSEG